MTRITIENTSILKNNPVYKVLNCLSIRELQAILFEGFKSALIVGIPVLWIALVLQHYGFLPDFQSVVESMSVVLHTENEIGNLPFSTRLFLFIGFAWALYALLVVGHFLIAMLISPLKILLLRAEN